MLHVDNQLGLKRQEQLDKTLAKFKDIFNDSLGKLKNFKLKLHLKSNAHPSSVAFFKAQMP